MTSELLADVLTSLPMGPQVGYDVVAGGDADENLALKVSVV